MSEGTELGDEPQHPEGEERCSVPVNIWPGKYVLLTQEEWNTFFAQVQDLKKRAGVDKLDPPVRYATFEVPDTGPRICPYCGMDFWHHRSRCRMMYADPNDPDAEY